MERNNDIYKRAWWAFLGVVALAALIAGRMFMIQVQPGERATAILNSAAVEREIEAARGQIFAHDGTPLSVNVPIFSVYWDARASYDLQLYRDNIDSLALCLSTLIPGTSTSYFISKFKTARQQKDRYALIADSLDGYEIEKFKSFPFAREGRYKSGFIIEQFNKRERPLGKLARRTIGIGGGDEFTGIERAYDNELRGKNGLQLQEKIAGSVWRPVESSFITEPEPGSDLITTLDVHLQDLAHKSLKENLEKHQASWGCVVLMEVETGMVRAMVNLSKEKNDFYTEEYNYAIGSSLEPGSTMKLATLMACLDEGLIDPGDSVATGNGIASFHKIPMKDSNWDKGGNGTITAEQCFEKSSNIGTAKLVEKSFANQPALFLEKLHSYGLNDKLGIELEGEGTPFLYDKPGESGWSAISITQLAIGYEARCTPLQTLAFYNAVANDGKYLRPQFVEEIRKNDQVVFRAEPIVLRKNFCSSSTLDICKQMMEGVAEKGGTAEEIFKKVDYKVAGKTGTARIHENGRYHEHRFRASFVGYFPAEDPKYSCIVVISDPKSGQYYGSTVAAPVFRDLANRVLATDPELHITAPEVDSTAVAAFMYPASKDGDAKALASVYRSLGIPNNIDKKQQWLSTTTTADSVLVNNKKILPGLVPDVKGMGLQDALFLLENRGMKVQVVGYGKVKRQSVTPGSAVKSNPYITIELS
ncbi:MAG: transpeptidase family protein [Flavobacteriales bacterium]|nr:transpeptidase family protein [Flavobacteriales bacterium]